MKQSDLPYYQIRNKILKGYLDKFPQAPTKAISRMLVRDFPEYFNDVEQTRTRVNYNRGTLGDVNRRKLKDKRYVKQVQLTGVI